MEGVTIAVNVIDGGSIIANVTDGVPITAQVTTGAKGEQGEQGIPGNDGIDGVDGAPGVVQEVVAGTNVTVDNTDPANPIVSATGGGGGAVDSVNGQTGTVTLDADDIDDSATTNKFATELQLNKADSALQNIVEDTTPQLGGNLDMNGHKISNAGTQVFESTDGATQQVAVTEAQLWVNGTKRAYATTSGLSVTGTLAATGAVSGSNLSGTNTGDQDLSGLQPLDADLTALAAAGNSGVLAATTASFLTADETKLDGIEALADVTDATNVNAAGATMNTDTTLAGNGYFLDEDNMASDSATKVPSQQSVKAYADTKIGGSTGASDEKLVRSDGTGGKTAQASDVNLDDSENMTFPQQTSYNTGTNDVSVIKPSGVDVRWDYTQTVQPTDDGSDFDTPETSTNMVGSAFRVVWDSIIDSTTTFIGPSTQAGFFGPQGVFQLQGKVRYNRNFTPAAMTPIGYSDQLHITNTVGSDRIISGGWQFMGNRTYIADTNNVTIERGDTLEGAAAFFDNTAFTTKNGGTMDSAGTDVYHFGFASSLYVTEDVELNGRATFLATDLNGPDVIHPRPDVGVVDKNIGLWIKPHSWGVKNLGILNESTTVNLPLTVEVADASATISILYSTVELNNTSGGPVTLTSTPTIIDGYMDGQEIMVINTSANSVTLQGQDVLGSSNIAGGAITLATGQSEKYTFSETTGLWEPRSKNLRAVLTAGYQPLDSDLTTIAGLTATTDNFIQSKSGAWASRTPAQVAADLTHNNLSGLTTGDPHTQYALLAGRSGGQTLIGGTASSNNLLLRSTSDSTKGYISLGDTPDTKVILGGTSMPADTTASFGVNSNRTFSAAGSRMGSDFRAVPTFNTTNGGSWTTADFTALPVATANMALVTAVNFQAGGSGAGTITEAVGANAFATSTGAAVTAAQSLKAQVGGFIGAVTNGVGLLVSNGQFFGSTTNATGVYVGGLPGSTSKVGVDIAAQTGASTTNIGIRNAATTVNTPATAQSITAVGNAITVASTTKQFTSTGTYTLTSAPTIANGEDGQEVTLINVGANTVTIQDQGTLANSNLRLAAATVAIAPRQSVKLMYSSTVGDWVQIGNLVTVI
jgi:hypothetical protein